MRPFALPPFQSRREGRHGIALIIILGCLIILSAVLLAFLSSAKTELVSSKMYADNNDIHSLRDTSVNMVMAQIRQATTATPTDCWTSQPGLIRTFNNSNPATPDMSYKLYSSDTMQVTGALNPATEAATLTTWSQQPAIYTDLNQPSSGVYPILDPSALSVVQGYSVTSAPTTTTQSVPMPVKWLYVLSDGTLVPPVATGTGTSATIAGADQHPIVGRIAFWTDDETCKLNINTASEGTYWDLPHFYNTTDAALAQYQPVQYEYQSYPGHPATVSLSTVFPNLVTGPASTEYNPFYTLAPRIQSGGSLNATANVQTAAAVTLDADRLYDSVDELDFNNSRAANAGLTQTDLEKAKFFITAHNRAPETTIWGTPKVACWPINADLAAHPNSSYTTPFDRLIAMCATLNGAAYYFQRQNKDSTTNDYSNIARNQTVYSYLHSLMSTAAPGFGGKLSDKYLADSDQILTEIFDYIRCTNLIDSNLTAPTSSTPPYYQFAPGQYPRGYGAAEVAPITIGSTRGFGRYTTISEAALWLICTADATSATSNVVNNLTLAMDPSHITQGLLLSSTGTTKQIRLEAGLILDPFCPMHSAIRMRPDMEILISGLDSWTIQGNADASATNMGFPTYARQTYTGANCAGVYQLGNYPDNVSSSFDDGGYMGIEWALSRRYLRARNGGRLAQDSGFTSSIDGGGGPLNQQYPFVGEPVTVNVKLTGGQLTFSGGPVTFTIRQRNTGTIQSTTPTSPGAVIQTFVINFPQMTMPAPTLPSSANNWTFQASGCGANGATAGRFGTTTAGAGRDGADVIYSMVPAQGGQTVDPRLIAMQNTTASNAPFSPHPWCDGTHTWANTLIPLSISGFGSATTSFNTGTLANIGAGNQYAFHYQPCPKVPFPAAAAMASGDWDNGIADQPDGGYLNETDNINVDPSYSGLTYYSDHFAANAAFTSPSRIMPSPGMFGSLPVGVQRGLSWQTLLFRRQPGHPDYTASAGGFTVDPDYLMMDMFWMPVVEPYAISEALSTAGKINMNYQIIPFSYIERSTGLYAVLKHEKVISVPKGDFNGTYKNAGTSYGSSNYRRSIQIPPTLTEFQYRFNNSDGTGLYAFRTPAEICDINLIPDDVGTLSNASKTATDTMMATYWANHTLTGDNCRERPYTTIYPHLTTRSNTFRVHYRVQALKKVPGSTATVWTEGTDLIASEGRGSVLIERYLDPNDTTIPDYAANPTATPSLESHYQFRVISVNRFAP